MWVDHNVSYSAMLFADKAGSSNPLLLLRHHKANFNPPYACYWNNFLFCQRIFSWFWNWNGHFKNFCQFFMIYLTWFYSAAMRLEGGWYAEQKSTIICLKCIDYVSMEHKLLFYGIEASKYLIKSFLTLPYFRSNCFPVVMTPGFVLRLVNHVCFSLFLSFCVGCVVFFCDQNNVKLSNLDENVPSVVIMIFCYFL